MSTLAGVTTGVAIFLTVLRVTVAVARVDFPNFPTERERFRCGEAER